MLKFNLYRNSRYKYNDYVFKNNPTSNDETNAIFFLCWYQQLWKWHRGGHACHARVLGLTAVIVTLNTCFLLSTLQGFPGDSEGEESACNMGDLGSIPALGRSSGGGHSNPLQYSCLENPHGQKSLVGYSP